jgi:hypothetical protein
LPEQAVPAASGRGTPRLRRPERDQPGWQILTLDDLVIPFAGVGRSLRRRPAGGVGGRGMRNQLIGTQTKRLSAAQPRQAPRQPKRR